MAVNQRKLIAQGRAEVNALWAMLNALVLSLAFGPKTAPALGNGTTAGALRIGADVDYTINALEYAKLNTDDLWDLSAETDTGAAEYRAYFLYLDNAGAASFAAGSEFDNAGDALASLGAPDTTKSLIGVFVADPACDFDDVGGLAAQGTLYTGAPEGVMHVGALDYRALVAG